MKKNVAIRDEKLRKKIEAQEKELKEGCNTYLVFDGKYYKIGKSKEPESRLKSLRTANPAVELICYSQKITEIELHTLYYNSNVGNEWFDLKEKDKVEECIDLIMNGKKEQVWLGGENGKYFKESTDYRILTTNRMKQAEKRKAATAKAENYEEMIVDFGKHKGTKIVDMNDSERISYMKWYIRSKNEMDTRKNKRPKGTMYRAFLWQLIQCGDPYEPTKELVSEGYRGTFNSWKFKRTHRLI